ncbi:hypothetical protein [Paracoccus xiamenensis]|uniref:hypothetical protein n=1 Tax=Paracoccus xiamenensis TaxID=2714901 RepID=UPI00140BC5DE|nr:hypothetical protein [Paracoccus xiamenensis]NHF73275.1 hypothetical protein [Paracoccus xiamenensis]
MELLNSKFDLPDYICGCTLWGTELCQRLDTPTLGIFTTSIICGSWNWRGFFDFVGTRQSANRTVAILRQLTGD